MATPTKSYDFSTSGRAQNVPKMQITSKKVIPTSFDNIESAIKTGDTSVLISPRRAETVLTFDLPNELSFVSEFDWSFEEKNFLQNVVGNLNSNKTVDTVNEKPQAVLSGIAQRIALLATSFVGSESAFRNAGYALSPLKEIFFNGNSNRSFQWSWDLYAKSESESDNILEAENRIREQAHPTMQDLGVVQIPNEFEISWLNCNLPKITTCACTSVEMNPFASGSPRFFSNGNPAFVKLSLSFTEIGIQTRNTLENLRSK